jgi:hypothetical protein
MTDVLFAMFGVALFASIMRLMVRSVKGWKPWAAVAVVFLLALWGASHYLEAIAE